MKDSLAGYIKITSANIRTLHRHLQGGQWFEDHERLAEYYEHIDEIEDNVVETLISIGLKKTNHKIEQIIIKNSMEVVYAYIQNRDTSYCRAAGVHP